MEIDVNATRDKQRVNNATQKREHHAAKARGMNHMCACTLITYIHDHTPMCAITHVRPMSSLDRERRQP